MSIDDLTYFDQIERYHDNEMTADERKRFENELLYNSELAEELELYKQIVSGIKDYHIDKFKKKLREVDFELDAELEQSKKTRKLVVYLSIAASFLLLIGTSAYFFMFNTKPNYNEIALQNREIEKGLPVFMSSSNEVGISEAMNFYKQNKYSESLNLLKKIELNKPTNDTVIYFIALNNELINNTQEAISYYEKLIPVESSIFKEKAEYRLSLCYLVKGDIIKAKALLKAITEKQQHTFKSNAEKVLKELN